MIINTPIKDNAVGTIPVNHINVGMKLASPLVIHELPLWDGNTYTVTNVEPMYPRNSDYVTIEFSDGIDTYVRRYAPRSLLFRM